MGKIKHLTEVIALFEKSTVVDFASVKKKVRNKEYAKLLVHKLLARGQIYKLAKGVYAKQANPELAVFAFKPAYFGLQDALSFHNLWEQETIPVIVTSRNVRTGIRSILGSNVLVRRVDRKLFFGYEYVQQDNIAYPYSDIEKTLIDLVYFRETIDSKVKRKLQTLVDRKKLFRYLRNYDKKIKARVLEVVG